MKTLWQLMIPVLLFSCGGEQGETDDNDNPPAVDTTENITQTEMASITIEAIENLEDYAAIKTKSEVINVFGEEHVKQDTSWFAEGTVMRLSVRVNNPETGDRVTYIFKESATDSVVFVEAEYQKMGENYEEEGTQKIKSTTGLYTGMSLEELVKWNGADINFTGFGWDYAGTVFSEPGSKLSEAKVDILLGMKPTVSFDEGQHLFGDSEFNSADAAVKKVPIIVRYMSISVE
ncbi:MAG: hypothetical protein WDZ35_02920 [Crocinitomicaceae bacterium]